MPTKLSRQSQIPEKLPYAILRHTRIGSFGLIPRSATMVFGILYNVGTVPPTAWITTVWFFAVCFERYCENEERLYKIYVRTYRSTRWSASQTHDAQQYEQMVRTKHLSSLHTYTLTHLRTYAPTGVFGQMGVCPYATRGTLAGASPRFS